MLTLSERIQRQEIRGLDGAVATDLEQRGAPKVHVAWTAVALQTHPAIVRQLHEDYICAGAW